MAVTHLQLTGAVRHMNLFKIVFVDIVDDVFQTLVFCLLFFRGAGEINAQFTQLGTHHVFVVGGLIGAFLYDNLQYGKDDTGAVFPQTGGKWFFTGKPQTDDVRSAPSITIIRELLKRGAKVKAYDPKAIETFKREVDSEEVTYVNSKYDVLDNADALILITEWKEFRTLDLFELSKRLKQKIIFDGRNIYPKRIEVNGFELYQIGC